jgi:hypothetical protein
MLKQLLSKTPVTGTPQANGHPVIYDGGENAYIDIEIQQHLNCADLMIRTIDCLNDHFREDQCPHVLNEQNIELYQLYMAKKSGKPNDDFPSIERT